MRKLKKALILFVAVIFTACGGGASTWQEHYDLGMRYLSEGNYEEAILSFTAAIEIDPKMPLAFIGRADAYIGLGETEENLIAALADYEEAVKLDDTNPDAYLGIADVYIRQGEYEKALDVLRVGLEKCSDKEAISNKIAEMESGLFSDRNGKTRRSNEYQNGTLQQYWIYEYDEKGNNIKTINYDANGIEKGSEITEYNEKGLEIKTTESYDGSTFITEYTYDEKDRCIREDIYDVNEGTNDYTIISYDENNHTETQISYGVDGEILDKFVIEYDENGVRSKGSCYIIDDNGNYYLDYYVEYIWNEDGSYGGFNTFQVAPEY